MGPRDDSYIQRSCNPRTVEVIINIMYNKPLKGINMSVDATRER